MEAVQLMKVHKSVYHSVLPDSWYDINSGYYSNATLQYTFGNYSCTVTFP